MSDSFYPRDTIERAMSNWWLIVVIMVLGAGVGWLFHQMHPPVYEAEVTLSTSIDFSRTGFLTDVEEDQAVDLIGDIISSTKVLERVVKQSKSEGLAIDLGTLQSISYIERQNFQWIFRIRHPDPNTASYLVNMWAKEAYKVLSKASKHALIAEGLLRYLDSLETCLEQLAMSEPVHSFCDVQNLDQILKELESTGEEAQREKLASQGLSPAMGFGICEVAVTPEKPVQYGRNQIMLSGAMIGFVFAIWAIYLQLPERIIERKPDD